MADSSVVRQYTIYLDPAGLVKGYAVREWLIGRGQVDAGAVLAQGLPTLEGARMVVPPRADSCLPRTPDDDPTIVETWI
jgi:hypothetical protein